MLRFGPISASGVLIAIAIHGSAAEINPLLPAETRVVAEVQVKSIMSSFLGKDLVLQPVLQRWPVLQAWMKATAIDPEKDIERLTLAGVGKPDAVRGAVILVHGSFDPKKIEAGVQQLAKDNRATVTIHGQGEERLYQLKDAIGQEAWVATLSARLLAIASNKKLASQVLLRHQGKEKTGPAAELRALARPIDAGSSIWLVGIRPIKGIADVAGSAAIASDFQMAVRIRPTDAGKLGEYRKFTEGIKAIFSLAALRVEKKHPILVELVAAVQVMTDGKAVLLRGQLSEEDITKRR